MQITPQDKRNLNLAEKASERGDKATALKYYLKAAEVGIVSAMLDCGCIYFEGRGGVEQNIDKSIEWFTKAADNGNSAAMNNIGYIFDTLKKHDKAIFWYEKSAQLGDVVAMLNLSNTYRNSYQDKILAQRWLRKAESLTDTASIRKVAEYYFVEDVVSNHIDKAIRLYRKAIKMGDTEAYKELGDVYFELEDFESAHNAYRDGANRGNVNCMFELGMMLVYVKDCFKPAKYWLEQAFLNGNNYALRVLGELHEEYGDFPRALRYYRKAVLKGITDAAENVTKIKKYLKRHKPDYKLKVRLFED